MKQNYFFHVVSGLAMFFFSLGVTAQQDQPASGRYLSAGQNQIIPSHIVPSLDELYEQSEQLNTSFDSRYQACLTYINENPQKAFDQAQAWRGTGGGWRARHCQALALYALGYTQEAARRMDALAQAVDGGSPIMRAGFYHEAASLWLNANKPIQALTSTTAGLQQKPGDEFLRLARARAYTFMQLYDLAKADLNAVLQTQPDNATSWLYRADVHRHMQNWQQAKTDIEQALVLEPDNIDMALLRGEINEALRQNALDPTLIPETPEAGLIGTETEKHSPPTHQERIDP